LGHNNKITTKFIKLTNSIFLVSRSRVAKRKACFNSNAWWGDVKHSNTIIFRSRPLLIDSTKRY